MVSTQCAGPKYTHTAFVRVRRYLLRYESLRDQDISDLRGYTVCLYDALLELASVGTSKRC